MHLQLLSSAKYLILVFFLLLFTVTLVIHYYISQFERSVANPIAEYFGHKDPQDQASIQLDEEVLKQLNVQEDCDANCVRIKDMKQRLKQLVAMKTSVSQELRQLEAKRRTLLEEITTTSNKFQELKVLVVKKTTELERVHQSLEQARVAHREEEALLLKSGQLISPPLQLELLPSKAQTKKLRVENWTKCDMHKCFDFSRCSLVSPFLVYFYPLDSGEADSSTISAIKANVHVTDHPNTACLYLLALTRHHTRQTKTEIESYLQSLPFWAGDGRNHLIINLMDSLDLLDFEVNVGRAMVAQAQFKEFSFRKRFDLIAPVLMADSVADFFPVSHCPARRRFFITFRPDEEVECSQECERVKNYLIKLSQGKATKMKLEFDCHRSPCANYSTVLEQSTFAVMLPPFGQFIAHRLISSTLRTILKSGAIPVVIGGHHLDLPLAEAVDWRRAAIVLPAARITELQFVLQSFSDADILNLRKVGQLLLERHLLTPNAVIDSVLSLIRQTRLQIPSPPAKEEPLQSIYNSSNPMQTLDAMSSIINVDPLNLDDEILGLNENPFPSVTYQRNYSLAISNSYDLWNDIRWDPFHTYPSSPFDPLLPSEAKFLGSSYGFRPIGFGAGGAGKEFSESLGGNVPKEQFTIVMLTYEREAVLIDSLSKLKGIPYLNKVLVVWNSPKNLPSADLRWPEIGVPIIVIKAQKNSLNNRFLPYKQIETDAILSMDDDAHLRHDEIVFGFRVWRETRDRIVGFPGRYHAWDAQHSIWHYNSNYSCELSMVLTGAAFFHKFYTFLYSYSMPKSIRDKVDEYMNCEDIAMNFLVSHISRQPPIKVTSRWTFRCVTCQIINETNCCSSCPGCPVSLSEDDSHFQERHHCMNFFVSVYGYMPLLNTQFRADSVLFKTRIPHDKQKCFKFI